MSAPSVSIFIDSGPIHNNLSLSLPGTKVDYSKVLEYAKSLGTVVDAVVFGALANENGHAFETALRKQGWKTRFASRLPNGKFFDWSVGLAVEALRTKSELIILGVTGPQHKPLVQALVPTKRIVILGVGVNKELGNLAHLKVDLDAKFHAVAQAAVEG